MVMVPFVKYVPQNDYLFPAPCGHHLQYLQQVGATLFSQRTMDHLTSKMTSCIGYRMEAHRKYIKDHQNRYQWIGLREHFSRKAPCFMRKSMVSG